MSRSAVLITSVLFLSLTLAFHAVAMAPNPKKENSPVPPSPRERTGAEDPVQGKDLFTSGEMVTIRTYFRSHPVAAPMEPPAKKMKTMPPGLKKKVERGGELPPGWQKKVARGEVLDAQIYAHSRPLPPELLKRLPPQPPGTIVITVEGKVVRLVEATLMILDVFDLI